MKRKEKKIERRRRRSNEIKNHKNEFKEDHFDGLESINNILLLRMMAIKVFLFLSHSLSHNRLLLEFSLKLCYRKWEKGHELLSHCDYDFARFNIFLNVYTLNREGHNKEK